MATQRTVGGGELWFPLKLEPHAHSFWNSQRGVGLLPVCQLVECSVA